MFILRHDSGVCRCEADAATVVRLLATGEWMAWVLVPGETEVGPNSQGPSLQLGQGKELAVEVEYPLQTADGKTLGAGTTKREFPLDRPPVDPNAT